MARRLRFKSTVLSIAIAQTQTEQTSNPTITVLTTQWAFQNSVNSERSDECIGTTDCATSAGFIGSSFPLNPIPSVEPARRYPQSKCARRDAAYAPSPKPNVSRNSKVPSTGDLRNPRETWPNLGAEAGFSTLNSADYG